MRSFMDRVEAGTSTCRWLGFIAWLGGEVNDTVPAALRRVFSSARLLRLVQQTAQGVGPWLLVVLEDRQRLGLTLTPTRDKSLAPLLAQDASILPLTEEALTRDATGLFWLLVDDLARLVRLTEAPYYWLPGPDWEARFPALAAALIRIRQLSSALECTLGSEIAPSWLAGAAAEAHRQATATIQAA